MSCGGYTHTLEYVSDPALDLSHYTDVLLLGYLFVGKAESSDWIGLH